MPMIMDELLVDTINCRESEASIIMHVKSSSTGWGKPVRTYECTVAYSNEILVLRMN